MGPGIMGLALMSAFGIWAAVSLYEEHRAERERKAAAKPSSKWVTGGVQFTVYDQQRDLRAAASLERRARDARKDREVRELERLVNLPSYKGLGH